MNSIVFSPSYCQTIGQTCSVKINCHCDCNIQEVIKRKHKEIRKDLITQKEVKGLFNCTACHKNAQKGVFSDEDVDIPNYGKWDKK